MLSVESSALSILLPLIVFVAYTTAECVDGQGNALKMHDVFQGNKDIVFSNFVMLTYDAQKRPLCSRKGKGRIALPGYVRFASGVVRVKKAIELSGPTHIGFSLEKNSMIVGTVCKNGRSKNMFVEDSMCHIDLFSLTTPSAIKQFRQVGEYDIQTFGFTNMIPLSAMDNPYVEGEWKVSASLVSGGKPFGGVIIDGEWIHVTTSDAKTEL